MKTCPFCGTPKESYNATCTGSYCQEASFYACMAKNTRAGKRQRDFEARAKHTARTAEERGRRYA